MSSIALKLADHIRDEKEKFPKIIVLSIAFSATTGGIATVIGNPPIVLAKNFLRKSIGYQLGFLE